MLASYNSETKSFEGLLTSIKRLKEIPPITDEIRNGFDLLFKEKQNLNNWVGQFDILSEHLKVTDKTFAAFLEETQKSGRVYNNATEALTGYQAYLQTAGETMDWAAIKTKALSISMKALSSIVWMALIGELIRLAGKGIEELKNVANATELCKERVDSLMDSYNSALSTANSNAQKVEELAERYEELSKGVDSLGRRVSLTTDEYKEYNSIVNQIADMFPAMIQGYTEEGNAILTLKGNVEELRDAYKETQKEAYNTLIAGGKDTDGNDILKNWQNIRDTGYWSKLFDLGAKDVGKGISTRDAIEALKAISDMDLDRYNEIQDIITEYNNIKRNSGVTGGLEALLQGGATSKSSYSPVYANKIREEFYKLSDAEKNLGGTDSFIRNVLGINGNVSEKDFNAAKKSAQALISSYQKEADAALKNVRTLADAYLKVDDRYNLLEDDDLKNAVSKMVTSIDEAMADGFKDKSDVSAYVDGILEALEDPEKGRDIKAAVLALFSLNPEDYSVAEAGKFVDEYIKTLAELLDTDENTLKIRLGFQDESDLAKEYDRILRNVARDRAYEITGDMFGGESDKYYEGIYAEYSGTAESLGIKNQENLDLWRKCCAETENAAEAAEKYKGVMEDAANILTTLSESQTDALKDYQSALSKLGDYYKKYAADTSNVNPLELMEEYSDYDWSGHLAGTEDLRTVLHKIGNEELEKILGQFKGFDNGAEIINQINKLFEKTYDLTGEINRNLEAYDEIEAAVGRTFNYEGITKLIAKYDELAGHIIKTGDGYKIEEDALYSLLNTYGETTNKIIALRQMDLDNAMESARLKIDLIKQEGQTLLNSYGLVFDEVFERWDNSKGDFLHGLDVYDLMDVYGLDKLTAEQIDSYFDRYLANQGSLNSLKEKYKDYQKLLDDILKKSEEYGKKSSSELNYIDRLLTNSKNKLEDYKRALEVIV